MPVLILDTYDPYVNLATEEVLLKTAELEEDLVLLWRSEPAFIVGRSQNPFLEVNPAFKDIPTIRRISGGGTIYQDMGTINYSIITTDYKHKINNYQYFLEPVMNMLKNSGLDVSFKPKSHLILAGKKISGNAQSFMNNRLLHHGTLLYDANVDIIMNGLVNYRQDSYGLHVRSNKQPVINIKPFFHEEVSITDVMKSLSKELIDYFKLNEGTYQLSKQQKNLIQRLAKDKYHSWDWIFGKTPKFEMAIKYRDRDIHVAVEQGIIKSVKPDTLYTRTLIGSVFCFDKEKTPCQ